MVRIITALCRLPVIKFRKGGIGHAGGSAPSSPGAPPATAPVSAAPAASTTPLQGQQTAAMSTISDMDLPARYRRAPLSQEEIDHINGGGIV